MVRAYFELSVSSIGVFVVILSRIPLHGLGGRWVILSYTNR